MGFVEDVQETEITGSLSIQVVRCKVTLNTNDNFATKFETVTSVTMSVEAVVPADSYVTTSDFNATNLTKGLIEIGTGQSVAYVTLIITGR